MTEATLNLHARYALQSFGRVYVRKLADVLSLHRIHNLICVLLDLLSRAQAFSDSSDDDLCERLVALLGSICCRSLSLDWRPGGNRQAESNSPTKCGGSHLCAPCSYISP